MPVFLAGEGYAKVVANTVGVPLYEFSASRRTDIMAGQAALLNCLKTILYRHTSRRYNEILKSRLQRTNFDK